MVDAHSSPAFAEQGRIAVDRHQPVLPAEERALRLRGHLPVARARTRPVGVEPVVPDLLELPVRDVDEEACDEPGDGIRHVLPPPLLRACRVLQSMRMKLVRMEYPAFLAVQSRSWN